MGYIGSIQVALVLRILWPAVGTILGVGVARVVEPLMEGH